MDNFFQHDKKCTLTKEEQQLLFPFVAFEKNRWIIFFNEKITRSTGYILLEIVK